MEKWGNGEMDRILSRFPLFLFVAFAFVFKPRLRNPVFEVTLKVSARSLPDTRFSHPWKSQAVAKARFQLCGAHSWWQFVCQ